MKNPSIKYANYLEMTRVLFANIEKHPTVKTKIATVGYDDVKLDEGRALRATFEGLYRGHLEKHQDRLAASQRVKEAFKTARFTYSDLVKRLRVEFRNDGEARAELGLEGERLETRSGFIEQATHFYNVAMTHLEIQTKIHATGLSSENIQAASDTLTAFKTALENHKNLLGECQELVEDRDQAFKIFRNWISAFITTCRSLFRDNPQTLEKLNVFVRNRSPRKPAANEEPPTDPGTNPEPEPNTNEEPQVDPGTTPLAA